MNGVARLSVRLLASMLAVCIVDFASIARAQSYGPGEQVLVIGSSAFRPIEQEVSGRIDNTDGYLYPGAGAASDYSAAVTLPEGAKILMVCLYAFDADPSAAVVSEMHAFKLVPGGTGPVEFKYRARTSPRTGTSDTASFAAIPSRSPIERRETSTATARQKTSRTGSR